MAAVDAGKASGANLVIAPDFDELRAGGQASAAGWSSTTLPNSPHRPRSCARLPITI